MKKIFALFAFIGVLCSVSAQKVNETVTMFGKDQLTGFTVNIDNASPEIVAAAMANKFEKEFFMKGSLLHFPAKGNHIKTIPYITLPSWGGGTAACSGG